MRHLKLIQEAVTGAAAAALSQVRQDLKSEIGADELSAMGKGTEAEEEERDGDE